MLRYYLVKRSSTDDLLNYAHGTAVHLQIHNLHFVCTPLYLYDIWHTCSKRFPFLVLGRHRTVTHGDKNLHTLSVKHYNDLLYGQSSERSIDKVTYFYVGDLFLYTPWHKVCQFSRKNLRRYFWDKVANFL